MRTEIENAFLHAVHLNKQTYTHGMTPQRLAGYSTLYDTIIALNKKYSLPSLSAAHEQLASAYQDLELALKQHEPIKQETWKRLEKLVACLQNARDERATAAEQRKLRSLHDLAIDFYVWYRDHADNISPQAMDALAEISEELAIQASTTEHEWVGKVARLLTDAYEQLSETEPVGRPARASTKNKLRTARNRLIAELKDE